MVQCLMPRDAAALLDAGNVEVIDVRDPDEWASGHLPGARNVPLGALKTDPERYIPKDRVLFVCARGQRSLTAAEIALQLGRTDVYSLEGGTSAWEKNGLPWKALRMHRQTPPRRVEFQNQDWMRSSEKTLRRCALKKVSVWINWRKAPA